MWACIAAYGKYALIRIGAQPPLNYTCEELKKGGFPILFASTCMCAHLCMRPSAMSGPFELNGYSLSPNLLICGRQKDEVIMTK